MRRAGSAPCFACESGHPAARPCVGQGGTSTRPADSRRDLLAFVMTESDATPPPWSASPAVKVRNAIQKSVTQLLDELAPEKVLGKVAKPPEEIEQHRTPSGCVLQAADCALSVSWFPELNKANEIGEMRILVWRGKVTRRGSRPPPKGATVVTEMVLRPIEPPSEDALWQADDGARYDTASLAAKCIALLDAQISADG